MRVTIKTFAHLRERLGFSECSMEVAADACVADVWQAASDESAPPAHVLAAINLEYARMDAPVHDGDEVAFFPPVTGG